MDPNLVSLFISKYQQEPLNQYFAPGRVNLIGEHIDYNGGLVLPCAITAGTTLLVAPNQDGLIRFSSLNFPEESVKNTNETFVKEDNHWFNYPLGVFSEMKAHGWKGQGLDLLYFGNIPIGSGLSSSASIEIVTAFAINDFFKLGVEKLELVKLSKRVENNFIGLNSGIMDQFSVTYGAQNKAILLNCDTLKYKMVDCELGDYVLAIINTNKVRRLEESKYNERYEECQTALKCLQGLISINHLCELNAEKLSLHSSNIANENILKRATHVVKENERVAQAAKALNNKDMVEFGRLMYASHQSLRALYEVSGVELDTIVDFCKDYEHVIGARMTGAGFGGCAIALLKKGYEEDFSQKLCQYYFEKIGYHATIYVYGIGNGVSEIPLS